MRWLLLFSTVALAQTPSTDQTGGISGTITDAITHIPVKKATVILMPTGNSGGKIQGTQTAVTDAGGSFALTNVVAGKYRLSVQQQNYPQSRNGGVAKMVEVKANETAGPVNVELMPGAVLSGHVVDEDGDPMQGCQVALHPPAHPEQGVQMMGVSPPNQDGAYRIYGVAPGKYIASAQCWSAMFQPRRFSAGPDPLPSLAYPQQYYPLTTEAKSAQVVELTAGAEKSGIDFLMNPKGVTQVRGAFSAGGVDWHGLPLNMQLISPDHQGPTAGPSLNPETGTFEFRQVFPGPYILVAFSNGPEDKRVGVWQRVEVADRPLELMLELKHAIELSGRMEIESSGSSTNKPTPNQFQIMLTPSVQLGLPGSNAPINEDGTFTLKGVMPAPWRIQVNGPGFLKSAWMGSTDVTHIPLDTSGGVAGGLRIVMSTNMASIRGSAPAGHMVAAQELVNETMFLSNRMTQVDQNGQYRFDGLPPGKYRLILMDSGVPFPEESGQEITVKEGETAMLDLKAP